jgi:hypothetical protein
MSAPTSPAAERGPEQQTEEPPRSGDGESYGAAVAGAHPLKSRRIWLPLAVLLAIINVPFLHLALRGQADVKAAVPFSDDFERAPTALGDAWKAPTGGFWRIQEGWLYSPGVKNNPLWLQAALPRDVAVEFDVRAEHASGDIKCEIFGDGRGHSTGYVLIFGGWSNTISTIARLDEHGADRKERRDRKVEKGRSYHFRIERRGGRLEWMIDGERFLAFDDPAPLSGPGHDRFGLSSWATDVFFDNVSVQPL